MPPEQATPIGPVALAMASLTDARSVPTHPRSAMVGMTPLYKMSERDIPPSGPLARLRAQLAGPRGYRRIDALLSQDDAAGAIAALSPNEVCELVHEVGFEDAQDLIELATPEQIQGCFDLDAWNKDTLEVAPLKPWLTALAESGFEKLGQVWGRLDS